jgi:hypothetical protein
MRQHDARGAHRRSDDAGSALQEARLAAMLNQNLRRRCRGNVAGRSAERYIYIYIYIYIYMHSSRAKSKPAPTTRSRNSSNNIPQWGFRHHVAAEHT